MNKGDHVQLVRTFSPLYASERDTEEHEIMALVGAGEPIDWAVVETNRRAVILAGAGVGKTHEMKRRAREKLTAGRTAFFIRVECIQEDFEGAFEVGDSDTFETWLLTSDDAWFYLDSVDEARLEDPRKFEKAIRCFARKIKLAQHRARIVISSRPYAWRSHSDHVMVQNHLPATGHKAQAGGVDQTDTVPGNTSVGIDEKSSKKGGPQVFILNDLTEADIRVFAKARGVVDAAMLVDSINRRNLDAVAARPFDLENIIEKWNQDGELGSRLDFLSFAINRRLSEINPDRERLQSLNLDKARSGARRLAAAVVFSGKSGIRIPDERPIQKGIDAAAVLGDWEPNDVHALLERGIFDDAIYGMVRFRHREVRELLAAEWLDELLRKGNSRREVENQIFREKYSHNFISPRLRPLLPWLILFDDKIRRKAIVFGPEIAAEGGDPSRLPLEERRQLLHEIVARIVEDAGPRSANDNDAIARIAEPDLAGDVLGLINHYRETDSVLFFLGRMVWQGKMSTCVAPLAEIAIDSGRGRYARIAAVRAVATVGSREDFDAVWDHIAADETPVDRHLAAEIVSKSPHDRASVGRLLATIERLSPYERYESAELSSAVHKFVEGFNVEVVDGQQDLARFIEVLNQIVSRGPHLNGGHERISRDQSWLLSAAAHAVEQLVGVRSPYSLEESALGIIRKVASARRWHGLDLSSHAERLQAAVPAWPALNDAVFWSAIFAFRTRREVTGGERVTDPSQILFDNFCHFVGADLDRVLALISDRAHEDDKLVAVTLAYRLIKDFKLPDDDFHRLRDLVEENGSLAEYLDGLANRQPTAEHRAWEERHAEERQRHEDELAAEAELRRTWIEQLRADPSLVSRPANIELGEMTQNQYHLMRAAQEGDDSQWGGGDWRSLVDTFGEEVAVAYREAGIAHWRHFSPALASDGVDTTSVPHNLIFGLAGLEMEADKFADFPKHLSDDELRLAMRYVPWQLNGFPRWLERAFRDRREIVSESLLRELEWDLGRAKAMRSYMLHRLVYHAPWLHPHIADWVITWLEQNTPRDAEVLRQAVYIAKSTDNRDRLTALAREKAVVEGQIVEQAKWFALWVDVDAQEAIPSLEDWLATLPPDVASTASQHFIIELVGDRRRENLGTAFESYRTPFCIKRLCILIHQRVRVDEDIVREGGDAYSPGLREGAQDARGALFNMLREIPGKETYLALRELADDHPNASSRAWMLRLANERAEKDGDVEDWSEDQLREFDADQLMTPATNDQLFAVTVQRLIDIRSWLEEGDDSPYKTWQRVEAETEMRNLIAERLNILAHGRYSCAQENEMPNAQRPDIWVQRSGIVPVPIEVKLLDKD